MLGSYGGQRNLNRLPPISGHIASHVYNLWESKEHYFTRVKKSSFLVYINFSAVRLLYMSLPKKEQDYVPIAY